MAADTLHDVARVVIESNATVVEAWLENKSGSWGFLAGQAVLEDRRRLGRRPTEGERRVLWHVLWAELTGMRR